MLWSGIPKYGIYERNSDMKKALIIMMFVCLIGCQKTVGPIDLEFESIDKITVSNGNQLICYIHDSDKDKKNDTVTKNITPIDINDLLEFDLLDWKPFVDSFKDLEFKKGKIRNQENGFYLVVYFNDHKRYVEVYEDRMLTYLEDEKEVLVTKDDYVKTLYFELSIISFPGLSTLIKKPIIYLYPEEVTDITVFLDTKGTLTTTYPAYNDGWFVTAHPDGKLIINEKSYAYLYWEGLIEMNQTVETGFVVKGVNTAVFLDEKLEEIGLNYKERNDFITYWLPEMEKNPYNKIHFMQASYDNIAKLNIRPEPDSLIRVFMVYEASEEHVNIELQKLNTMERKGFTVVDWGGAEIK